MKIVKVKVTMAKKREISYSHNVKLQSAVKFVHSMRYSAKADRMVRPPFLSRDQKYTHSRVVCIR